MGHRTDYRGAGGSPLRDPLAKASGSEASDRARERLKELEDRKKTLEDEFSRFLGVEEDWERIAELEREVAELEANVEAERARSDAKAEKKRSSDMDPIKQLETIEKAAANATAGPAEVRKAAEGVYDDVVRRIAEREGCDMRRAHYLAAKDRVGKRAYAAVIEMQNRERAARDGALRLGAYLG